MLRKWDDLPEIMKCTEVKEYYDILATRRTSLWLKRFFDVFMAGLMLIVLAPIMLILGVIIKIDSNGPILFKQIRITSYGRKFKVLKFRSMIDGADQNSGQLTAINDQRVTRVGAYIRHIRLDELPQLFNIIKGDMSFVGTRPEVPKYVEHYTKPMLATLLLPAGVTSEASILYKDENRLLGSTSDVEKVYIEEVLPEKMHYNLMALKKFGFLCELKTMVRTVFAVCGKAYKNDYVSSEQENRKINNLE